MESRSLQPHLPHQSPRAIQVLGTTAPHHQVHQDLPRDTNHPHQGRLAVPAVVVVVAAAVVVVAAAVGVVRHMASVGPATTSPR